MTRVRRQKVAEPTNRVTRSTLARNSVANMPQLSLLSGLKDVQKAKKAKKATQRNKSAPKAIKRRPPTFGQRMNRIWKMNNEKSKKSKTKRLFNRSMQRRKEIRNREMNKMREKSAPKAIKSRAPTFGQTMNRIWKLNNKKSKTSKTKRLFNRSMQRRKEIRNKETNSRRKAHIKALINANNNL